MPRPRIQRLRASLVALALGLVVPGALGAPEPVPEPTTDRPESGGEPSGTRRALATGAAIVPGVLVHGSGSWVLGDDATAKRLLLLEGIGIGGIAGGLAGAAVTGAARSLTGAFIATGIGGLALFSFSFAADVYRVTSPRGGFGVARPTPFFESDVGYVYVNDPVFSHHHFVHYGLRLQPGRVGLEFEGFHAPFEGNARVHLAPNVRLWQGTSRAAPADGSYLDVSFGATRHQFVEDNFNTNSYELEVGSRLDSQYLVPDLRGAFGEFWLGHAWRETLFTRSSVTSHDTVLLGGFGFGVYLGEASGAGGEAMLYYDHRHDDFAAGLKSAGLGSGVPGHIGLSSRYYLSDHFGVTTSAEVGSAWVLGLGIAFRQATGPVTPFPR